MKLKINHASALGHHTLLPVHKQLAESLILLKLGYCNELLFGIRKYRRQQLQKVQNAAAGFALIINIICINMK